VVHDHVLGVLAQRVVGGLGVGPDHDQPERLRCGGLGCLQSGLDRRILLARADLGNPWSSCSNSIGGGVCVVKHLDGQGVVCREAGISPGDAQGVGPGIEAARNDEGHLGVGPAGGGTVRAVELEHADRTEANTLDRHRAQRLGVAVADVRPVDVEDLRGGQSQVTHGGVGHGGVRCQDRRCHLGGRFVGHGVLPGPALEVRGDRPEPGVVVGVLCAGLTRVIAREAVHVRAGAGGDGAVEGVRGGDEGLIQAVEVGVRGVAQPTEGVIETHRHERQALGLAVVDAALVQGQSEVVQRQTPEVGRQRDVGEQVEVGRCGLPGTHGDQLVGAGRLVLALERASAAGDERLVLDRHDVQRARARRDDAGLLRRWLVRNWRDCRIGSVGSSGRCGRRVVLLRQEGVTVEDVDVLLPSDLVHGLVVDGVVRDVDGDDVVARSQVAEPVVAVDRLPGRAGDTGVARAYGDAHHRRLDAHPVRNRAELGQRLLVGERGPLVVTCCAATRRLPGLGGVRGPDLGSPDQRATVWVGVGDHDGRISDARNAEGDHLLAESALDGDVGRSGHVTGHRVVEAHWHVRDARLVGLAGRLRGIKLVAGRVVADRADDAAVGAGRVGLDAPVDLGAEADDGPIG